MSQEALPNVKIAIVGLGYVGLPLAVAFASKYPVLGFDINPKRIEELLRLKDKTREVELDELSATLLQGNPSDYATNGLSLSDRPDDMHGANVFIITVPTPVNEFKSPDLSFLLKASEMVAKVMEPGAIVICESTTYPGCTEEDCVPVLERVSGMKYNTDFFVGYSPERINPGDRVNKLTGIMKVTSGSTPEIAETVDQLYRTIITAGTHKAPSIKVAEASKAIENAQRDINISFMNELALIFDRLEIDTHEVLQAAATKWNFLPFKPGLVGGHCISVDPYYLAHKAESVGYHPEVILSGRRVNDNMGLFVASKVVKLMIKKGIHVEGAKALILGITFKENCPDIRNSKVVDIYNELGQYGIQTDIYDPWANQAEVQEEFGIEIKSELPSEKYDAIIIAVGHHQFKTLNYAELKNIIAVLYDTKALLDKNKVDGRL